MMTDIYPVVLVVSILGTWLAWAVQQGRLLSAFKREFPDVARERIPCAFEYMRHPEKVLFFHRKSSVEVLRRDPAIWKLRQQVRWLTLMAVLVPLGGGLFGFAYAVYAVYVGQR